MISKPWVAATTRHIISIRKGSQGSDASGLRKGFLKLIQCHLTKLTSFFWIPSQNLWQRFEHHGIKTQDGANADDCKDCLIVCRGGRLRLELSVALLQQLHLSSPRVFVRSRTATLGTLRWC